jgi:hypothetical protein
MFGDAKPVVDRPIAAARVEPRRRADVLRLHADGFGQRLGAIAVERHEFRPEREGVGLAAFGDEAVVDEILRHYDMGERRHHGDVRARADRQMHGGFDMRRANEIDAAGIDDDELRALAQPLLHARGEDGVAVGRVGADQQNDIRLLDAVEILRAGRGAEGLAEAVPGRRVADAGAGIDVVVAETTADELLHEEGLLVGAARGGDAADSATAVARLDAPEL